MPPTGLVAARGSKRWRSALSCVDTDAVECGGSSILLQVDDERVDNSGESITREIADSKSNEP